MIKWVLVTLQEKIKAIANAKVDELSLRYVSFAGIENLRRYFCEYLQRHVLRPPIESSSNYQRISEDNIVLMAGATTITESLCIGLLDENDCILVRIVLLLHCLSAPIYSLYVYWYNIEICIERGPGFDCTVRM